MSKTNRPEILRKTGENTYESQDGSIVVTRHERTSARTEETITLGRRRVRSADRWYSVCRRGASVLSAVLVDTLSEAAAETAKMLAL